jgi:import inner membrane translocase subunit TIM23
MLRRFFSSTAVRPQQQQQQSLLLPWNEYFQLRLKRKRVRPLSGVPGGLAAGMAVVTLVPFNPFDTVMGADPSLIVGAGAVLSIGVGYQAGAAMGQLIWRLANRTTSRTMDTVSP